MVNALFAVCVVFAAIPYGLTIYNTLLLRDIAKKLRVQL